MPRFQSIIESDEYGIGCTGQTVWVWDKNENVLAKFKDLTYAYNAAISPRGDIFVLKNPGGRLAVYSLKELSLIKKFRFSKLKDTQDDGFCFSSDGQYFLNVERHVNCFSSVISVYDTKDFSLVSRLDSDEKLKICHVQEVGGEYFVLGYMRVDDEADHSRFVAKFRDNKICDMLKITDREYFFYWEHLWQTLFGRGVGEDQQIKNVHTLGDLWSYYSEKQADATRVVPEKYDING